MLSFDTEVEERPDYTYRWVCATVINCGQLASMLADFAVIYPACAARAGVYVIGAQWRSQDFKKRGANFSINF